jgi:FkbM family methyltransferase
MLRHLKSAAKPLVARAIPEPLKEIIFRWSLAVMRPDHRDDVGLRYQMASMEWSLANLARLGFRPRQIIDVGAYHGDWTRMIKEIFPDAEVLMVEAQPNRASYLDGVVASLGRGVRYVTTLLGAERRSDVPFYELETGSSVFPEQTSLKLEMSLRTMEPLDEVAAANGFNAVGLLKLDVQGYELEVLKGAPRLRQSVEVVLMEVSLLPGNKGAPLLHDVVGQMKEYGFVAYDLCSFIRRPRDRALWQTDFIFVRENSAFRASDRVDAD